MQLSDIVAGVSLLLASISTYIAFVKGRSDRKGADITIEKARLDLANMIKDASEEQVASMAKRLADVETKNNEIVQKNAILEGRITQLEEANNESHRRIFDLELDNNKSHALIEDLRNFVKTLIVYIRTHVPKSSPPHPVPWAGLLEDVHSQQS